MKAIVCEMCGSHDFVKSDGFYVCQACGTKYSTEDAKKLMIEGTVNIQGDVKIDHKNEYENYILVAKQNLESGTWQTGYNNCEKALSIIPKSSEAWLLKAQYLNRHGCMPEENIISAFKYALEYGDVSERKHVYQTIEKILDIEIPETDWIKGSTRFKKWCAFITQLDTLSVEDKNHLYNSKISVWYETVYLPHIRSQYGSLDAYVSINTLASAAINKDTTVNELWWYNREVCKHLNDLNSDKGFPDRYTIYEPQTTPPQKSGCYIATCVYGTYDCPQVWALRRYRDDTLGSTWFGRAFIRIYYAISPTLVKWFGKTTWFKKMWKGTLDRMIKKLEANGVENTPYQDKNL